MPEVTIHRNVRAFVETGEVRVPNDEWVLFQGKPVYAKKDGKYDAWPIIRQLGPGFYVETTAEPLGVIVKREPQPENVIASEPYWYAEALYSSHNKIPTNPCRVAVDFIPIPPAESDEQRREKRAREAGLRVATVRRNNGDGLSDLVVNDIIDAYQAALRDNNQLVR